MLATELQVGMRILRPVEVHSDGRMEVEEFLLVPVSGIQKPLVHVIQKTERGTYTLRANWGLRKTMDPHAWVAVGMQHRGIVCFCNGEVPDNWIAFDVVRLGKDGRSVVVKPITGTDTDLFAYYLLPA
ncbi:MAG: hypothetical protein A2Y38_17090 [Spirochaetes bacterium GWB1_59_5]|nr:MAG: hypothetical protein A2Y38_17090 [Spirochaetes bacterium GWB1_59_5]